MPYTWPYSKQRAGMRARCVFSGVWDYGILYGLNINGPKKGESSSASLSGLGTQEDGNARALAWAARKPGAPDPNDPPVFGGASASLYGGYDDFSDDSDHG